MAEVLMHPIDGAGSDAATVNGHTVESNVPADAKFTDTTYSNATTSAAGLMSSSDKAKLDGIGAGSNVKSVNGKTGAVNLSKADVGLGNVDNTRDADKPFYKLGSYDHQIGNCKWNDAGRSLYKIRNFYAISGEGDYFYLAHKKHDYTITTTKHFSGVNNLFTSNLSNDCYVRTDLCSETDPAILTITSDAAITATDVLTLLFIQHTGGSDASRFNHWKLEILAVYDSTKNWPNATVTWKAGDWITVFERTNASDIPNGLYCYLNPYRNNGVSWIYIKGIRLTIYAATPRSQKSGDFGYNAVPIGRLSLLDSRPSFSPAESLGALDIAGGTVYGKTTFQEGISATSFAGASATSSADGLMSKADKAKLDGIGAGSNVKSVNGKTGAVTLTKSDIGLSNVDNTADSAKSVKYATSAGSANSVAWGNVSEKPSTYPPSSHTHTPAQVGLGNVANLDQSKAIKSITRSGTTFTATALDGTTTTFTQQDNNTTYTAATSSADGLMSAADKSKLDGIGAGSNVKSVNGKTGAVILDADDVGALPDTITIPTKTSDLTNDSDFMSGMTILSYGHSTWSDFITAYTAKHVVYCRASTNADPASGSQTRMAFMAYVDNESSPTNVEFQYYRSVSSHSATQQGDQVYVYKLDKTAGWTVTARECYTRIVAGTGLKATYSNGVLTIAPELAKGDVGLSSVANLDQSKAIKSITRSGTTFTATALDGTKTTFTQQDSNTTYDIATASADGLMSKTDKAKLDSLSDSGIHYVQFKLVDDYTCSTTDSFDTIMSMIQSNKPVQASVNTDGKIISLPVFMCDAGSEIMFRNDELYIIWASTSEMIGDSTLAIYGPTITDKLQDNDTTETSGQAALDAHMGKVLSDRIADQASQFAKNTAQIETAGTATNAHSVGEYVMISNALYKVTASVAKGDTWTIGTNVTAANIGSEISSLKSDLADKLYPVGSIYMSVNPTNPAKLFGGTWEQIKDRFLLAAGNIYDVGSTGGGEAHNHKYGLQFGTYWGSIAMEFDHQSGALRNGTGDPVGSWCDVPMAVETYANNSVVDSEKKVPMLHYKSVADTSSASNMPPYLAVYMWKRTA